MKRSVPILILETLCQALGKGVLRQVFFRRIVKTILNCRLIRQLNGDALRFNHEKDA